MKKQVKLTESELYSIIKEAATNLIKEYGSDKGNRDKMARAAKRSLEKGDASTYHNALNSLYMRGSSKDELADFQKKFEEGDDFNEQPTNTVATESKQYKVNESQLFGIIRESVKRILGEAFKSPKLDAMARQHGGVRKNGYGFYGGNDFPIADLTDDMIGDEASQLDTHTGIADNAVNFKDGTSVPIINKEKAMSMQKGFNDVQSQRGRYSTPTSHYSKFNVAPTEDQRHLQALRKDLGTSNRLKQDPSDAAQRTYKQHWKDFEGDVRRQINQAYGQSRGQRNIQNIGY